MTQLILAISLRGYLRNLILASVLTWASPCDVKFAVGEPWWERCKTSLEVPRTKQSKYFPGRANILSKYIIYTFFNFGHGFCSSFPILLPKSPGCCKTKFELIFAAMCFYIYELKNRLRFLESYFKVEILIFLPFVVLFLWICSTK